MSTIKRATAVAQIATENRARQVALSLGLSFVCFVLLTQFVRAFFG